MVLPFQLIIFLYTAIENALQTDFLYTSNVIWYTGLFSANVNFALIHFQMVSTQVEFTQIQYVYRNII